MQTERYSRIRCGRNCRPCCRARPTAGARRRATRAALLKPCFGWGAPAWAGATCRRIWDTGTECTCALPAGATAACGNGSRTGSLPTTGAFPMRASARCNSTRPASACTNTRPARPKKRRAGHRPQPGRAHPQAAPELRRGRQRAQLGAHPGPAGRPAAGPAPNPGLRGGGRHGLRQRRLARAGCLSGRAGSHSTHPTPAKRAPFRPLCLRQAPSHRTDHQQTQATPTPRHALRQT